MTISRAYIVRCDARIPHKCHKQFVVETLSMFLATLSAEEQGWKATPYGYPWPGRFSHECPGVADVVKGGRSLVTRRKRRK